MPTNSFIEAARSGANNIWRYVLTVLLSLALLILGTAVLSLIAVLVFRSPDLSSYPPAAQMALELAPFAFLILGLWLGLNRFHHRPLASLIRPAGRFRWRGFLLSAGFWLALAAVGDLVLSRFQPGAYHFSYDPAAFWPYALVTLLLLPIQVLAEELYFRGYLTQGFGLAGGFYLAWLVPAVLFGLLHGVNPEALQYGWLYTLPIYIGSGLILGWLTLRSAGLEMALGLHFANNLYGALFVTATTSAFSGPTLFKLDYSGPTGLVVFLVSAVIYLALVMAFGRGFFENGDRQENA